MELTGRAKKDFEKWLEHPTANLSGRCSWIGDVDSCQFNIWTIEYFYQLPESMRYGVYVDWFDSVGINVDVFTDLWAMYDPADEISFVISVEIESKDLGGLSNESTRAEARTKAIEKAKEIYNERH